VVGGHTGVLHSYPSVAFSEASHVYDIKNDRWEKIRAAPVAVQGLRLVADHTFVYAFGGFVACAPTVDWQARSVDTVYRYSIVLDKWDQVACMPRRRSSNVAGKIGKRVYLVGGWDGTPQQPGDHSGRFQPVVEAFDLGNEQFAPSSELLPAPLRRAFAATVVGGRIIVAGGLGEKGFTDLINIVASFDPKSGAWSPLPNLPEPLFSPGVGELNGNLYVAGGVTIASGNPESSDKIYMLRSGDTKWLDVGARLSSGRSFVEVLALDAQRIGFLGGHGDSLPTAAFEVLDTSKLGTGSL
jgi:N-acetylneuraminic acid mutarotase